MRGLLPLALAFAATAPAQVLPGGLPGDRVISAESIVYLVGFASDGLFATASGDFKVRFWDPGSGELKRTWSAAKSIDAARLAQPADLLITGDKNGEIKVWDFQSDQPTRRISGLATIAGNPLISRDRKLIAAASRAKPGGSEVSVRLWDVSGAERFSVPAGLGGISAWDFSPSGDVIVETGYDTNLRVWSTRNGELLRLIDELPLTMFAMAFSPDGKYLATGGADRIVYLWDTKTWKLARKLSGQPEMISAIAFSADSRLLITGGFSEFTVKNPVKALIWDVESGQVVRTIPVPHMVTSVAFSPEGRFAATACAQTRASIWTVPRSSNQP